MRRVVICVIYVPKPFQAIENPEQGESSDRVGITWQLKSESAVTFRRSPRIAVLVIDFGQVIR